MHVRVTRGTMDPAHADEVVVLTEEIAEAMKKLPGFRSYQGGLNRSMGTLVAISTWEDEDAANFPRESLGDVLARVLKLGVQLEPADVYEVVRSV